MKNPKFLTVEFSPQTAKFSNLQHVADIAELLHRNRFELFDTFFNINDNNKIEKTLELIDSTAPAFWAIVDPKSGELAGVAYLYDWVGNGDFCFSVKVSTCFARKFWGKFAHRAGKLFLRYIAAKYNPLKISAEVFESNAYPRRLLANLGFEFAYKKPNATMQNGVSIDVLGYDILFPHQKRRVNKM